MKRRDLLLSPINRIKKIFSPDESTQKSSGEGDPKNEGLRSRELANAISTDFGSKGLMHELMQMGIDPSNYTLDQMIDIIITEMEKRKPQQ